MVNTSKKHGPTRLLARGAHTILVSRKRTYSTDTLKTSCMPTRGKRRNETEVADSCTVSVMFFPCCERLVRGGF